MKIKTNELIGLALDWAVANCEGYTATIKPTEVVYVHPNGTWHHNGNWRPTTNWAQAGPIIEREEIGVFKGAGVWLAEHNILEGCFIGTTPLIAAMRCFVALTLGDEVEIPDELL